MLILKFSWFSSVFDALSVIAFCSAIASLLYLWIDAVHNEIYESTFVFRLVTIILLVSLAVIFAVVIAFAVVYGRNLTLDFQFFGEYFIDYSVLVVSFLLLAQGLALLLYALVTRSYLLKMELFKDRMGADSSSSSTSTATADTVRSSWFRSYSSTSSSSVSTTSTASTNSVDTARSSRKPRFGSRRITKVSLANGEVVEVEVANESKVRVFACCFVLYTKLFSFREFKTTRCEVFTWLRA